MPNWKTPEKPGENGYQKTDPELLQQLLERMMEFADLPEEVSKHMTHPAQMLSQDSAALNDWINTHPYTGGDKDFSFEEMSHDEMLELLDGLFLLGLTVGAMFQEMKSPTVGTRLRDSLHRVVGPEV